MTNNKMKVQCEICDGVGIVKNVNLHCINCNSTKCEFTMFMSKDEFYKYKFCEFCIPHNHFNTSPKTYCIKCSNKGYYLNKVVICNSCKIPHRVCNCSIKLYDECTKCCGSGTI